MYITCMYIYIPYLLHIYMILRENILGSGAQEPVVNWNWVLFCKGIFKAWPKLAHNQSLSVACVEQSCS